MKRSKNHTKPNGVAPHHLSCIIKEPKLSENNSEDNKPNNNPNKHQSTHKINQFHAIINNLQTKINTCYYQNV